MSSPINAGQFTQIPTASEDSKDLLSLPPEIVSYILNFIDPFELPRVSLVCRRMQAIVGSSLIQWASEFGGEDTNADTAMKSLKRFFFLAS